MEHQRDRSRPGLAYHAQVHAFRFFTVILAWVFIVSAFYQRPELLTAVQRFVQRCIETVGNAIPSPWGPRLEFGMREIGGVIWLQITMLVIALRLALSTIAGVWRLVFRKDRSRRNG